jgi:hypothetical protein
MSSPRSILLFPVSCIMPKAQKKVRLATGQKIQLTSYHVWQMSAKRQ